VLATGELWLFLLQVPLANLCMCVLFARTARGPNPLVARLAAEVVALRQPDTHHPGLHRFFQGATWLWAAIFLLLAAGLAVMMVTESTKAFLMLSTAATIALVIAGTAASTLWFLSALRRLGLKLRFTPA
jgi:divalent metal cation (Fe/Co/Zn/Cd) transporter